MNNQNLHLAIIMDGNGRWAAERGLSRLAGHRAGARTVRTIVEAAAKQNITTLTLYAFSSDNWLRPAREVQHLMILLKRYLLSEVGTCQKHGIRISVIGRRDRLTSDLIKIIDKVEKQTCGASKMHLRLAVDYSSTHAIATTAIEFAGEIHTLTQFAQALGTTIHAGTSLKPVDLLIRTGGEQRLSDFLLWECAYAELLFTTLHWPDFSEPDLCWALSEYAQRDRRYGRIQDNDSVISLGVG